MKKRIALCIALITIFLYMLPSFSLATNTTEIKITVHEIKVNCKENGSYTVNKNNYVENNNFYIGHNGSITIDITPQEGNTLKYVNCEPKCNFTLDKNKLVITNITENITVDIMFKANKLPDTGIKTEENKPEEKTNQKEKHCCWICWLILLLIVYITYKVRKVKKS